MAKVIISKHLEDEINKKFKKESIGIFSLLLKLEDNPKKGKLIGNIGGISIFELKYDVFRFYYIADSFKIKILKVEELTDLIIKFVRMSNKKEQQKVIEDIKFVLRKLGSDGF